MYQRNYDHLLNRQDEDAILYPTATGVLRLTRADFDSEEEFLRWKSWSDQDYALIARQDNAYARPLAHPPDWEALASFLASEPQTAQSEPNALGYFYAILLRCCLNTLSAAQYSRLTLYLHGVSMSEIARVEGVSRQSVSESIAGAKRKLARIMKKL